MDKVLVDIRQETSQLRELFRNKDTVLVLDLINAIDNLLYEKHCLEEQIEDLKSDEDAWAPDPYKEWRDRKELDKD